MGNSEEKTIIHDCIYFQSKQKTIILINIHQCLFTEEHPLMSDLQLRLNG